MNGNKCSKCGFQAVQLIDVIEENDQFIIWAGQCLNCGEMREFCTELDQDDLSEGEFE